MDQHADDDFKLLERYVRNGCERSFRLLVDRHLGLVLACALRTIGDRQLAEEVAQRVFALLANKAAGVRSSAVLGAWLHRATVFEATRARRGELRRRARLEAYAKHMSTKVPIDSSQNDQWNNALPVLDEVIDHLPQSDRMMLVMRFFEGRNYREIGTLVGKSEEASRKQIKRALEKLSASLQRKGIVASVAVLTAGLTNTSKAAASATLVDSVSSAALSSTASSSTTLAFLTMKKLTTAIAVLAAIPITIQGMKNHALAKHIDSVREELGRNSGTTSSSILTPRVARAKPSITEAAVLRELASQIRACEKRPDETRPLFAALSLVQSLKESQLPQALEMTENMTDEGSNAKLHLYEELLAHWATFDPVEAMRRVEAMPTLPGRQQYGLRGVLRIWMKHDLSAALAAVKTARINHRSKQDAHHIASWSVAATNPEAVAAYLPTMERGVERDQLLTVLTHGWMRGDPDAAIPWAAGLEDSSERDRAMSSVVGTLMAKDPEAAFKWADTLSTPKKKDEALKNALRNWIWFDQTAAEEWIESSTELTDEERNRLLNR